MGRFLNVRDRADKPHILWGKHVKAWLVYNGSHFQYTNSLYMQALAYVGDRNIKEGRYA